MAEQNITIRIRAIDEASAQIQKVSQSLQQLKMPEFSNQMGDVQRTITNTIKPMSSMSNQLGSLDIASKVTGVSVGKLQKELQKMNMQFIPGIGIVDNLTGKFQDFGQTIRKAEMNTRRFRMEMLSILFFGTFLQRTFGNMTITTTKFFMSVTEGQTEAGQAITRLSASWQFLKFTIGDAIATALMPLIPTIVDIVDAISNFIQEHPKLVAAFALIGTVAGFLLFTIGTLYLGFSGLATAIGGITSVLGTSVAGAFFVVTSIVFILIIAIKELYKIWSNNLYGLKDITTEVFGFFSSYVWPVMKFVFKSLIIGIQVVTHIFAFSLSTIYNLFKVGFLGIKDLTLTIMNFIVGKIESAINNAISIINTFINAYNAVAGILGFSKIGTLGTVSFSRFDTGNLPDFSFLSQNWADLKTGLMGIDTNLSGASTNNQEIYIDKVEINSDNPEQTWEDLIDYIQWSAGNRSGGNL